jgi:hypothetical protein
MYKISQKELLEEGFWDKFPNTASFGRQVKDVFKTYGSVLAPEIADPIKKGVEFMRGARKSRKRAGLTEDELVREELIENGYYPFDDKTKIRWATDKLTGQKKKNTDDTYTGAIKVGQLGYDNNGQPFKEADYNDPLKSLVTFKLHPKTREFKIIQHPNRTIKVKPAQGQAPTPPAPTPPP